MNTINKIKYQALLFMCLIAMTGLLFTSCESEDLVNTSQMGSSRITLKAYGPTPALRGGELRFIGDNLDRVTAINVPGAGEVSDFTQKGKTEIRINIPQNATVGYPSLITPQGEIKTTTLLTYEEPISISSITSSTLKAGDQLVIEGDYLNLIKEVIFTGEAVVSNFVSQARDKIVLIVPAEAQPGKVRVSNGAEIPIEVYSAAVADIVEPAVTSVAPLTIKAGAELTIKGTDLDLTGAVVFTGGSSVSKFAVNEAANQLTVKVPADAQDGPVTLLAKSQLEYVSGSAIILVVPTGLTATPATGLKAGNVITIAGTDLDLVTSVRFPGLEENTATASVSATKVTVTMPAMTQSGDLLLNLGSGKTVPVAISTQKPAVASYNPSPVTAGGTLTVKGTNLDLVASITFGGEVVVEVEKPTATQFSVAVPVGSESGDVILTMLNGEEVKVAELEIISPVFCFIPILPADDAEILSGTILAVDVENIDKLTDVKVDGTSTQFICSKKTLSILVPLSCKDGTEFTLVSSNGEVTYTINIIYAGKVETVIMDEEVDINGWGGSFRLYKEDFKKAGFKAGSILRFYATVTGSWPMVQISHANWGEIIMPAGPAVMEITDVIFTQDMIDTMMSVSDGWSDTALVVQGDGAIIHSVSVIVEN